MTVALKDVPAPVALTPSMPVDHVTVGPPIPPQQRIMLYSPAEWESFIHEWVHCSVKQQYQDVQRFTGVGDHGIDIAGFVDAQKLQGAWDNYQCKHYATALAPTDAWPEIGKILWYSFKGEYKAPRTYLFIAPRGAGTKLTRLLADAGKLKDSLIENWDKHCGSAITESQDIALEGEFLAYVKSFNFSIFVAKTSLAIIDEHKASPFHTARFGGDCQTAHIRRPLPRQSRPSKAATSINSSRPTASIPIPPSIS